MKDVDLGRLFAVMIDHVWLIVFITLLSAEFGYFQVQMATPIYQAKCPDSGGAALEHQAFRYRGQRHGRIKLNTPSEVLILQSRMVLGQVVDRLERGVII
nr:Wzz/FepE/Etk N-terminal domain-containing protein [Halomonas alimentaria]